MTSSSAARAEAARRGLQRQEKAYVVEDGGSERSVQHLALLEAACRERADFLSRQMRFCMSAGRHEGGAGECDDASDPFGRAQLLSRTSQASTTVTIG